MMKKIATLFCAVLALSAFTVSISYNAEIAPPNPSGVVKLAETAPPNPSGIVQKDWV